jgi:5'-3' exonuclease
MTKIDYNLGFQDKIAETSDHNIDPWSDCIVAPYEADAQLAFLSLNGLVDLVISEDSDLAPFGCQKILCKMDIMGNGTLVSRK